MNSIPIVVVSGYTDIFNPNVRNSFLLPYYHVHKELGDLHDTRYAR